MLTREQFESFCSQRRGLKYDETTPYQYLGYTVATNGCIALLINRKSKWEGKKPVARPDFSSLRIDGEFGKGKWSKWEIEVGEIPPIKTDKCIVCNGKGEWKSKDENGKRITSECEECEGSGSIAQMIRHSVFGYDFQNNFLWKFKEINPKECRIFLIKSLTKKYRDKPMCLLIRGEGWNGILMSMSKE